MPGLLDFFPASYVYEHREEFVELVGWRWVMSSVGKDYPELIDREKLTDAEWVHVVVDLRLMKHKTYIEDYLYRNIASMTDSILCGEYHQDCPMSLRDLRQGFGYYRPGEDSGRLRRPVRWLGKQNALHYWI